MSLSLILHKPIQKEKLSIRNKSTEGLTIKLVTSYKDKRKSNWYQWQANANANENDERVD